MAHRLNERRPQESSRRGPRRRLLLLIGVIAVLTAVFVYRLNQSPSSASVQTATGANVPTFSLPSTAGHPIALSDFKGKVLVVYFYEGST